MPVDTEGRRFAFRDFSFSLLRCMVGGERFWQSLLNRSHKMRSAARLYINHGCALYLFLRVFFFFF